MPKIQTKHLIREAQPAKFTDLEPAPPAPPEDWLDEATPDQATDGPPVGLAAPPANQTSEDALPPFTEVDKLVEDPDTVTARNIKARKIPKPPGYNLKFPEFQKWLARLTPLQWNHMVVYVYRTWPVIKRQLADEGASNYIDKLSQTADVTLDYMQRVHGGGDYRFDVSDSDERKQVCVSKLTIPWSEYEPKLVFEELVLGVPINKVYVSYLQQKGVLDVEGNKLEPKEKPTELGQALAMNERLMQQMVNLAKGAQPQPLDREVMLEQIKTTSSMYKSAMDQALKKDNVSEASTLGQTVDLLSKVAGMLQPKEQAGGIGTLQIIQMMQDNARQQQELMLKMMDMQSNKAAATDPIDQVTKFFGLFERLQDAKAEAPAGKRSTAEVLIDAATKMLPSISNVILAGIAAKKGAAVQIAAAPMQQPQGQIAEGEIVDQGEQVMASQQQAQQAIAQYGGLIISAINKGQSGDSFAEWVADGFGMAAYNAIANYGKDAILGAMKATPAFWQQAQPIAPQVEKFVDEFLAYPAMLAAETEMPGIEGV